MSPEFCSISGKPKPLVKLTPRSVVAVTPVLTAPEAREEAPTMLALESNALTTPPSAWRSGDWIYLRTPSVVEPESRVQETTVPLAVPPPASAWVIVSSAT